jgi:hypothetical protein
VYHYVTKRGFEASSPLTPLHVIVNDESSSSAIKPQF